MNLLTTALSINLLIALFTGSTVVRKPRVSGTISLSVLCFIIAILSMCVLLFGYLTLFTQHLVLAAGIYLTTAIAASAQFLFVVGYTKRKDWINRWSLILLAIVPVLTQVLFWTTPWRNIFFGSEAGQAVNILFFAGPWAKFSALYIFSLSGASAFLLFDASLKKPGLRSGSYRIILSSSFILLLMETLILTGLTTLSRVELLPFAFTLAALGLSSGPLNQQPEETSTGVFNRVGVVEDMEEGWMVLNPENLVVDINPAAERMAGLTRDTAIGQPIASVLGDLPNLGLKFNGSQDSEVRRSIKSEAGWRYLNIRTSHLTDHAGKQFGRLLIWRDITDRRLADDARQRARDEMFVLINAISSAASNSLNLEEFLLETIYHIIYPFRSQVVGIFLLDERTKKGEEPKLFLASHFGFPPEALNDLTSTSPSSPIFDWVYQNRLPLQIDEPANDLRLPDTVKEMKLAGLVIIPLIAQTSEDSKLIGFMTIARKEKPAYSQDEIARLTTISDHIATLIDSDRRRKLAIALSERQRLMRDLHDSVSQKLYGLVTTTEASQAALEAGETLNLAEVLSRIGESARQAVKEMRLFLYQMQPIDVDKDGLISVLHHRLAAVEGRADIKARLLADEEITISKDKEIALYYISQEALNNVLRHARAKSISVTLKQGRRNVILEIRDDGCGFDPKKVDRAGLGMRNMKERISQINGNLRITSKPGEGTTVTITVRKDPLVKPIKRRR
jgi:PAS domain S-box-containing protein